MGNNNVFENQANLYEEWFIANNNLLDIEVEIIKRLIPAKGTGIEIGTGTGIFSSRLGIHHGVEPSKKMREKAIAKGIEVIDAFAENLPIEDTAYDFALMITVDCFLDDIDKAFKEVFRILSNGGCFIIAFIDRETPLGVLYNQNKHSDNFYKNAQFNSSKEIENFLESSGFVVEEQLQTVFSLENKPQEIKAGSGEGVFAVIKAKKL